MTATTPPDKGLFCKGHIRAADVAAIADAAARLQGGGIVAVPTETVYGLAANAADADAVAKIYAAKGRPDFNPLIVHVASLARAEAIGVFGPSARRLAEAFWPGPLTMVVPLRADTGVAAAVTAGLPTVALRCPGHPVMRALLEASGLALAAPSANSSGGISPTRAAHVAASLGGAAPLILDGGPCEKGVESTIVALRCVDGEAGWQVLRPGPVTHEEIAALLGEEAADAAGGIEAPGQMVGHYAPSRPIRLDVTEPRPGAFHIGFGEVEGDFNLSPGGDPFEAAARLYEALHLADGAAGYREIAVAPIPQAGIGRAIADRLNRAAARPGGLRAR